MEGKKMKTSKYTQLSKETWHSKKKKKQFEGSLKHGRVKVKVGFGFVFVFSHLLGFILFFVRMRRI